jgi:GntR family transcriptional regulator, transcriptional repressor for pyruvate dehydrogenase complex
VVVLAEAAGVGYRAVPDSTGAHRIVNLPPGSDPVTAYAKSARSHLRPGLRPCYQVIRSLGDHMIPTSSWLTRDRLPDRVATELKRRIGSGTYPAGQRLPSIRALADQLGVTAPTVREALAQLETAGLVRTRHGAGTFVLDPGANGSLVMLAEMIAAGRAMTPTEIQALLAFRAVVIAGFVDAIALHATDSQLAQLDAITAEERAALGRPEALAALDFGFNEVLAAASGNLFYVLLLRSLREAHLHLGALVFGNAGDGSVIVQTHEAIVRALRKRDAGAVRRRMQRYLDGGAQIVNTWLKKERP